MKWFSFDFNASGFGWLSSLLNGNPIGLFICLLLVLMSIWTWAAILYKMQSLNKMFHSSEEFLKQFWKAKSLSEFNKHIDNMEHSPTKEIFKIGFQEMVRVLQTREKNSAPISFETVKRALIRQKMLEEFNLSKNMNILSISASAAPFIGLFGTVIGIVQAFHDIGASGATSLSAVAPGISEALFATALGLFVAIPAVIFYNIIINKIRKQMVILDGFTADFLNILERHYSHANST